MQGSDLFPATNQLCGLNILKIFKYDWSESVAFSCLKEINLTLELQFHAGKSYIQYIQMKLVSLDWFCADYKIEFGGKELQILKRLIFAIWLVLRLWYTSCITANNLKKMPCSVSRMFLILVSFFLRSLIRNTTLSKTLRWIFAKWNYKIFRG